jgi:hypothetical protein
VSRSPARTLHGELLELLARWGDRTIAEEQAPKIHAAMLMLARGQDIGREADTGYFARPRRSSQGPAKDLRDLASAARRSIKGAIDTEEWFEAWAAQPRSTWKLCRPSLLLPGTRNFDPDKLLGHYRAPGYTLVVPKPHVVLPALQAQLDEMKGLTGNKKKRTPDLAAREAITVIRAAYKALTGKPGGRTVPPEGRPGPLVRFGREIDKLFGTKVFPRADSSRLKKDFGDR